MQRICNLIQGTLKPQASVQVMKPNCVMFFCFLIVGCGYLLTASAHEAGNPLYENHEGHLEYAEGDANWHHEQEHEGHQIHEQHFEEHQPEQHHEEQHFQEQHHEEQPFQEQHHEEQHFQEQHHEEQHFQEQHHEEQHFQEQHHEEQPFQEQQHEEQHFQEQHHEQHYQEQHVQPQEEHFQEHSYGEQQHQEHFEPSYEEQHSEQHEQVNEAQQPEVVEHVQEQEHIEVQPEVFEHVQEQEHIEVQPEHHEVHQDYVEQHQPGDIDQRAEQHNPEGHHPEYLHHIEENVAHVEEHQQEVEQQQQQQHDIADGRQIWEQQYEINYDHIRRHMAEDKMVMPSLEGMSASEMRYHLFAAHDHDKNAYLDGIEMIQSITHDEEWKPPALRHYYDEQTLISYVDFILANFDLDRDGMVSYPEFVTSLLPHRV